MLVEEKRDIEILLVWPAVAKNFTIDAPSMGMAYLAAVLEPFYSVKVLECLTEKIYDPSDVIDYIKDVNPKVVGFSLATLSMPNAEEIVTELLAQEERPVLIAGGPHPSALPEETLAMGFDYVVVGEAEVTIIELMDHIHGKPSAKELDDIDGIVFNRNGQAVRTKKRALLDVTTLPYPAWHYFKVENYKGYVRKIDRCLPIMGGRGCPESCTFCYKGVYGTSLRVRPPEMVIDEIQHLKNNFQIEEFVILDENFTLKKSYVLEFCKLIVERNIDLPWHLGSGVRVDAADEEVVAAMKRAGCYRASLGVESGNEEILKEYKKRINKDQVRNAVKIYKKYGYEVTLFFLVGAPSETRETMMESIKFAIELDPDIVQFNAVMPFPGTALFDYYDSKGRLLTKNWKDYNIFDPDLAPVYNHPNLTHEELKELRNMAYRKFYYRFGYAFKQIRKIRSFTDVKFFFRKAFTFLGFMKSRI